MYFCILKKNAAMFKYLKEKKQKLLRFLFGTFSFTALMFAFQACYGMPEPEMRATIQGEVTDLETNEPIKGLEVASEDIGYYAITDENGRFYDPMGERILNGWMDFRFTVTDIDSTENGEYESLNLILQAENFSEPLHLKVKKVSDAQ